MRRLTLLAPLLLALLAGCDMLGVVTPERAAAVREADGRATGGACRHAGRAIEDCYALNKKADRAAIFAGWREMNDYMRENHIEAVAPQIPSAAAPAASATAVAEEGDEPVVADKPARAERSAKGKGARGRES